VPASPYRHALRLVLLLAPLAVLPRLHARDVLKFAGVNLSGAQIGSGKKPGVLNVDYVHSRGADEAYFPGKCMHIVRLPVWRERLQPSAQSRLDAARLALIKAAVQQAKTQRMHLIVDIHNYTSYYGGMIGSAAVPITTFSDLWQRLALEFKDDTAMVFALRNAPNTIAPGLWAAAQAAVDAIRVHRCAQPDPGAGCAVQRCSGAHSYWTVGGESNATALASVYDPLKRTAIETHPHLDTDSSGTSAEGGGGGIGAARLVGCTTWLRDTGHIGFLSEFGAADRATCRQTLVGMLGYIEQHRAQWLGWSY
jgi:endoglucanase